MSISSLFSSGTKRSAVAMEEMACLAEVVKFLPIEDKCRLMITCLTLQQTAGAAIHWQKISLRAEFADDPNALISCVKRTNTKFPLETLEVEGESFGRTHAPHCEEDDVTCASCATCTALTTAIPGHLFQHLRTLVLHRVPWLTACVAEHILANAPELEVVDIQQNINVNRVVRQVASSCRDMTVFSFKYIEIAQSLAETQVCLETNAVSELAASCSGLKAISFNHYLIDEDVVETLLKLPKLEHVDFSDNEGLHGFFLAHVPQAWPNLRVLKLRDCTELQETAVQELVAMVVNGACANLTCLDLSCQWAHINQSFIANETLKRELALKRPRLQWVEDHCQIPGFGIDPDEEIWYCMLTTFWCYLYAQRRNRMPQTLSPASRSHAVRFLRRVALEFRSTPFPTAAP